MKRRRAMWIYHRLKAMSVSEVTHRLVRFSRNIQRKRRARSPLSLQKTLVSPSASVLLACLETSLKQRFYPGIFDVESWIDPKDRSLVVQRAEEIVAGIFPLLGGTEVKQGLNVDWLTDPVTGRRWPLVFSENVPYRHSPDFGDIRFLWELNRQYHSTVLALAYQLTNDQRYAETAIQHFRSWWEQNPEDLGPNWTSAMEVAIRAYSWVWLLALLLNTTVERSFLEDVVRALVRCGRHVFRCLSLHSSANNHLIVESSVLVVLGLVLRELPEARSWLDKGTSILEEEVLRQVYPDGVDAEQAFHYHVFALEALLTVMTLPGFNLSEAGTQRVIKMLDFLSSITTEKGEVVAIGDSDDGRVLRVPADQTEALALLSIGAVVYDEPRWRRADQKFCTFCGCLLGKEGRELFLSLPVNDPTAHRALDFPDGGYTVFRGPTGELSVFDYGPLGLGTLAAHGHADALALTLHVQGRAVLDDPGTYLYNGDPTARNYFRSTRSHNTITVDGADQSEQLGTFLWGRKASSGLQTRSSSGDLEYVSGVTYAFHPVRHERHVYFLHSSPLWIIRDRLSNLNGNLIEGHWHVGVGISCTFINPWTTRLELGNRPVYVTALCDDAQWESRNEWRSPSFGVRQEATTLVRRRASGHNSREVNWLTIISYDEVRISADHLGFSCNGYDFRLQDWESQIWSIGGSNHG